MKTIFNWIGDDWKRVKNHCRTTDNKDFTEKEATDEFKWKLLMSEHSPIRLLEFDWSWKKIYYWVSTEWSRHKFEKFIASARDDRGFKDHMGFTGFTVYDSKTEKDITYYPESRNDAPQKNPVNYDGYANMQSLIDSWRKRLCRMATDDARELAEDFKITLHETHPLESNILVPNCVYRGGCPEMFGHCKFWPWFVKEYGKDYNLMDLNERYEAYNNWFYGQKKTLVGGVE